MPRQITPAKRDRILKLHASNPDLTHSTIALRCGLSTTTVWKVIQEAIKKPTEAKVD